MKAARFLAFAVAIFAISCSPSHVYGVGPRPGVGTGPTHPLRHFTPGTPGPGVSSPLAWFDSSLSRLTDGAGAQVVNGVGVKTATDVRTGGVLLSQATAGLRFTYDTATTAGGYPSIAGTTAAASAFPGAGVGLGGTDTDWTLYVVGAFDGTNTYAISDGPIAVIGTGNAHELLVGTAAGAGWSVAGVGAGSQISSTVTASHTAADQDFYLHLFTVDHRASDGRTRYWVDGRLVASGNSAYSLTAGIGFGDLTPYALRANTHQWALVLRAGVDSDGLRRLHELYFARFQVCTLFGLGDSLVFGHPDGGPGNNDILSLLAPRLRALGCSRYNFGIVGNTSAQILARVTSVTNLIQDPGSSVASGVASVTLLNGGTNDGFASVSASTTLANMSAAAALIRAKGGRVVVLDMLPAGPASGKPAGFDSYRATLNSGIAASTWHDGHVPVPVALSDPTDLTQFKADQTHPVSTVGHGYDAWTVAMAPLVKSLLRLP
jgi:lysophospholipase L1-like esterase